MGSFSKNHSLYFVVALLPLVISGCGGNRQKKQERKERKARARKIARQKKELRLSHLNEKTCDDMRTDGKGSAVYTKALKTEGECIDTFGESGKYLLRGKRHKIIAFKMTIENNSKHPLVKTTKDLPFKTVGTRRALKKMRPSALFEAASTCAKFTGANFLVGGAANTLAGIGVVYSMPLLIIASVPAWLATTPLFFFGLFAPIVRGVKRVNKNRRLSRFVRKHILPKQIVVMPGETKTFLFFVRNRDLRKTRKTWEAKCIEKN